MATAKNKNDLKLRAAEELGIELKERANGVLAAPSGYAAQLAAKVIELEALMAKEGQGEPPVAYRTAAEAAAGAAETPDPKAKGPPPPDPEEKIVDVAADLQVVYKGPTRTLGLRSSGSALQRNPSDGTVTRIPTSQPVRARFVGGIFILNKTVAMGEGVSFDEMRELMENHAEFLNGMIIIVQETTDPDIVKETIRKFRTGMKGPELLHGPRTGK